MKFLVLALLGLCATAVTATKLKSELVDGGFVYGPDSTAMTVSQVFSAKGVASAELTGCADELHGASCLPRLTFDDNDFVDLDITVTDAFTYMGDSAPTDFTVFRCWTPKSTEDRPWRKIKDDFSKTKQCKKVGNSVNYTGPGTYPTFTAKIPSPTPDGTYFYRIAFSCDDTSKSYCALYETYGENFAVDVMDSVTPGIVAGVVVCVIVAPVLLVGFFVFEKLTKKQQ